MHQNVLKFREKTQRKIFPFHPLLDHANISCLVNAFLEILELKRSLVEGQQLHKKDRMNRKGESEKKNDKNEKPSKVVARDGLSSKLCLLRMLEQKSRQT